MKKRLISLLLVLLLVASLSVTASAQNVQFKTASHTMRISYYEDDGILSMLQGTINLGDGSSEPAWLIIMDGADTPNLFQVNNYMAYFLSSLSLSTNYFRMTREAILNAVPKGSKLIFAGHSLGGMTAQQLAADNTIKKNYEVVNIVAYGSPLVVTSGREGSLHRLADRSDPIPLVGIAGLCNTKKYISFGDGSYGMNLYRAHYESYRREDVWGCYDVLGVKNGSAVFTADLNDIISFDLRLSK